MILWHIVILITLSVRYQLVQWFPSSSCLRVCNDFDTCPDDRGVRYWKLIKAVSVLSFHYYYCVPLLLLYLLERAATTTFHTNLKLFTIEAFWICSGQCKDDIEKMARKELVKMFILHFRMTKGKSQFSTKSSVCIKFYNGLSDRRGSARRPVLDIGLMLHWLQSTLVAVTDT